MVDMPLNPIKPTILILSLNANGEVIQFTWSVSLKMQGHRDLFLVMLATVAKICCRQNEICKD